MGQQQLANSTRYVWGKFLSAHAALVKGNGDLRNRVKNAYLEIGPVMPKDVPEEYREELQWIKEQTTGHLDQLNLLEDAKVEEIAGRISRFYEDLRRYVDQNDC